MDAQDDGVKEFDVEVALEVKAELGEGPVWDERRQELLFVDITGGARARLPSRRRCPPLLRGGTPRRGGGAARGWRAGAGRPRRVPCQGG